MKEKDSSTKEKIIKAVLEQIASEDIDTLSVRQIADQAGVNIAAINYHFRTKENLIYEAVLTSGKDGLEQIMKMLKDKDVAPEKRLKIYLEQHAQVLITYPKPSMIAIQATIINKKSCDEQRPDTLTEKLYGALFDVFAEITGKDEKEQFQYLVVMLNSASLLPFLSQDYWKSYCNFDFSNEQENKSYIDLLFSMILQQLEVIKHGE